MDDPKLGWDDPIAQARSLRDALKELLALGLGPQEKGVGPRERFDWATSTFIKYRGWLERLKYRRENIFNARIAVRRDYVRRDYSSFTVFHFERLRARERRALADDISPSMRRACLTLDGCMRGEDPIRWPTRDCTPRTRRRVLSNPALFRSTTRLPRGSTRTSIRPAGPHANLSTSYPTIPKTKVSQPADDARRCRRGRSAADRLVQGMPAPGRTRSCAETSVLDWRERLPVGARSNVTPPALDDTKEKTERQQRQAGNRTHEVQIVAGNIRGSPVHPW